jgi:hypothetical protein
MRRRLPQCSRLTTPMGWLVLEPICLETGEMDFADCPLFIVDNSRGAGSRVLRGLLETVDPHSALSGEKTREEERRRREEKRMGEREAKGRRKGDTVCFASCSVQTRLAAGCQSAC